ncbi:odorant receptor 42b-like [Drosophila nasuta]|uniref:odorant receptor 42b-like n=1 Tax=Drosophila nasuta TaxID=42062 RepID=UPI00295EB1DB|nr:odorant receptor 42b-like [Drosophila nasuta]
MLYKLFPRMRVWTLKERQLSSRDALVYLDRGMCVVGWMPPKNKCWRRVYALWSALTTVMVMILLVLSLFISYIKDLRSFTAGQFLTSLSVALNCLGLSIKASYTFAGMKRFQHAKKLLDRMDERCRSAEQREQLNQNVARCNRIYMCYQVMYCFYAASTFLAAACSGQLPWKLYNPLIDWKASDFNFWLAAFVEYVWMSGAVMQDQIADLYPIIYFLTLRTHLLMLKQRLERLRTDPRMNEDENYAELIKCIIDHRLIIEFCNTLKPVVSGTICVQFLLCGVVIGLSMINIIYFSNFWTGLGIAFFICDLLMETFPFCYICNMIITDCEQLTNCLFHSNWQSADRRYRTTFLYFLQNIQQPIVMTAGGVFVISLGTNITVAKLAFSVVTCARQLNIAEKFS